MHHHFGAPGSFWDTNFFKPDANPAKGLPSQFRRDPSDVPDTRLLFQIQTDALNCIEELKKMGPVADEHQERKRRAALYQVENSYRGINRYLRTYASLT